MASLGGVGPLPAPPVCWRTVPGAPSTTLHTHTLATEALGLGCELRGGQLSRQALGWALGWASSSDRSHLSRWPEGPITWLWTPEPPNLPVQGSSSMSWLPSGCVSAKSISVMCPTAISSTADPRNCWKCFSDFTERETASHSGDWCASLGLRAVDCNCRKEELLVSHRCCGRNTRGSGFPNSTGCLKKKHL